MDFEKLFTLEEAQGLVPWVRRVFGEAHRLVREIQGGPGAGGARPRPPGTDRLSYDPSHAVESLSREQKKKLVEGVISAVLQKGIVIQDFQRGLIDFPALRGGQAVFLCYELADGDRIGHWHDLDAGFAGRRPIEEFNSPDF